MTKTAKLYGGSLYELAAEENLTEGMLTELTQVKEIFEENPDYLRLLSEPSIPKAERLALLDKAFGEAMPYLLNFLKLLCEGGLLFELGGCLQEFKARYNADHNIAEAVVTSAVKLSDGQSEALKKKLEGLCGKTIILTQKMDEKVLGGLKVELEGKQLDGTASGRLGALRKKVIDITL